MSPNQTSTQTTSDPTSGRGRIVLPVLIAILFLAIALFQAHLKLLWGDEFVTYWIGQQRSFRGIWSALASGADPNPPLMHLLNWASTSLFGSSSIAVRLPSILAVGLALTSLWCLLRRYVAPVYAAAGCLALMTTRGFDYTYDARSYGLLLGFALAALAAWNAANQHAESSSNSTRRYLYLAAMALALACGLSSNYYGVLAFFPIAAGELYRLITTRKLHPGVWLAMFLAALPLLAFRPLIHANLTEFGPHAWNKPQLSMISDSYLVIVEGIIWPVLILFAIWLWKRRSSNPTSLPTELRIAAATLLAYPIIGFALAYPGSAMISPRCVIPVCAGVAIVGVDLLARLTSRRIATGIVLFLFVWVSSRELACALILRQQRHAFLHFRNDVERAAAPGERVLIGDSLVVMPLYWYASPALRQQIVFPIDFAAIHRFEPDDSGEQNLWGGRNGVFPVPIASPAALIPHDAETLLVASPTGWLAQTLTTNGFTLHADDTNPWGDLGGVFTPLAHPATRIYFVTPATPPTIAANSTADAPPAVSSNP